MKQLSQILFLALFAMSCAISTAQTFSSPVEYMNHMGEQYSEISQNMWDYTKAASHGKRAKKIDSKRKDLINSIITAKRVVSRMPGYEDNTSFRDSVISYLHLSHLLLTEDYAKIVDMEEIAEDSYDMMEAYMTAKRLAKEKLDYAARMVSDEQKRFAVDHNITILESNDKISKNLELAAEVYDYYDPMFLIFFKPYKQELYFLDAMRNGDVNAMEQNKEALLTILQDNLKTLEPIKAFKSDYTLKKACKELLTFYNSEATNDMPVLINYYLEKENFENIKKAFDAIPQSKRTQEDVDTYNNAIKSLNDAVALFNETNGRLDKERQKYLTNWNKAGENFLDRHVP